MNAFVDHEPRARRRAVFPDKAAAVAAYAGGGGFRSWRPDLVRQVPRELAAG
jgi:hypothetical protein